MYLIIHIYKYNLYILNINIMLFCCHRINTIIELLAPSKSDRSVIEENEYLLINQ